MKAKKDYNCEFCGKSFLHAQSVKKHINIIHEGKSDNYICDICEKSFASSQYLIRHMKNVHDMFSRV